VVDHYQLDARWEAKLRRHCKQILVIDDKADRPHDCTLLLDQNFNPILHSSYLSQTPPNTRLLLGPRYALLPPGFAANREMRSAFTGEVKRVLICFGGSDPRSHTAAAITAIIPFAKRLDHIDIVVGLLSPHKANIAALCSSLPNAHLHSPADNMPALLLHADLAIGAGGTMNWERACLGVPSLVFGIADNQVAILGAMIQAGFVGGQAAMPIADSQSIARWIGIALDNPAFLRGLSLRSSRLVDGRGTERVAGILVPKLLNFRPVNQTDSDNLLRWRNDPKIREVSINTDAISPTTHHAWLLATLADPSRRLLIAESEGEAVGVVRFDLAPPLGSISVYLVPDRPPTNLRLVEQATDWLHCQHPEIKRIIAEVKPDNQASLSAFRAAGYCDNSTSLVFEWKTP
jgi:UDP-2,4-diacetamido-2,4,6-trideoxy-beta-L-altropyranose hydrolase